MPRGLVLGLVTFVYLGSSAPEALAQRTVSGKNQRTVLVELFTSQGCNMCPTAEKILGEFGESTRRAVTLAFHVDYFNDPWKDPFSDKLNSQRQAAYNAMYTKPKHPDYGLYYTPMVMVDGLQTVNGRDPEGLRAAVRAAQAKPPKVEIDAALKLGEDPRSGELRVSVTPRSPRVNGRELLVCAVLRDDRVVTKVGSGENANKTLTARYPARTTRYEYVTLDGKKESASTFPFRLDPTWDARNLGLVVFVQDKKTGEVYQSALLPWGEAGAERAASEVSSRR